MMGDKLKLAARLVEIVPVPRTITIDANTGAPALCKLAVRWSTTAPGRVKVQIAIPNDTDWQDPEGVARPFKGEGYATGAPFRLEMN